MLITINHQIIKKDVHFVDKTAKETFSWVEWITQFLNGEESESEVKK
jgi:hypothetical protein